MRSAYRLTTRAVALAGLAWVSGCASTAQVESLRAELAQVNATAARAALDAARAKRELAELKEALASAEAAARQTGAAADTGTLRSGYKWGELEP